MLETLVVSAAERLLTRGHRERELLGVDPLRALLRVIPLVALARSRLNRLLLDDEADSVVVDRGVAANRIPQREPGVGDIKGRSCAPSNASSVRYVPLNTFARA